MSTKRKLSKYNATLEINLRSLLGKTPPIDEEFRDAVAQKAIDIIEKRTKSGKDWKGNEFKSYSSQYKASDDFKAFGKTSKVNLTLTGDMLGLLDKISDTRDKIALGWDDATESAKAANHIQGVTVKKRDFFNLNDDELKTLRRFAERLLKDGEG